MNNLSNSLIINGDFEFGNSSGWHTENCLSGCTQPASIENVTSCQEKFCYHIVKNCQAYQYLQQAFSTGINQQYQVQFEILGDENNKGGDSFDVRVAII